jgi:hypothetical protein
MFMLKKEIDKSVTKLLRPDPKLLNAMWTPPQRTRWETQGEQTFRGEYRTAFSVGNAATHSHDGSGARAKRGTRVEARVF